MKITCQKAVLLDAITTSQRAVSVKNAIPALEGILLSADSDRGLVLSAYNLEVGIRTSTPASVLREGAAILNARLLSDIVRKLPDDQIALTLGENGTASIKCGPVEYDLPAIPAAEFPDMPSVNAEKSIALPQGLLKDMIAKTLFAIAISDAKPVLTGLFFDIKGSMLRIVAIDNFRMAMRKEDLSEYCELSSDFSFILPGQTARELEKILGEKEETVSVTLSKKHICFTIGDTTVISRLIDGEYYNYHSFIPKNSTYSFEIVARRFSDAAERVSLILNERLRNNIRFSLSDGVIRLSCVSTLGRAADEISVDAPGVEIEIGFNSRFLLDALHAVPDEKAKISLTSPIQPCMITPVEGEKYLYIVMPVRLKADEN